MPELGFPGGAGCKEPACQCRRYKRCGFDPWARKISWRRPWQPTPVFLSGESYGQRSLWATVYGVSKSWTWLKRCSRSSSMPELGGTQLSPKHNSESTPKASQSHEPRKWCSWDPNPCFSRALSTLYQTIPHCSHSLLVIYLLLF